MIYLELFWTFFKIGAFTFGGGYAMLPLIQAEVESHGWMASADLVNFVAVSESTPGPFAVNISTYVGTELAGIPGGIFATLGVVLPSFLIILLVARCFEAFRNSRIVSGCMAGLKPAVIGLIGTAPLRWKDRFLPPGLLHRRPGRHELLHLPGHLPSDDRTGLQKSPSDPSDLPVSRHRDLRRLWTGAASVDVDMKKSPPTGKKSPRPHGLSDFCF